MASQLYLKLNTLNFALVSAGAVWLVVSGDFLFYYAMPGYSNMLGRYLGYVPLTVVMSGLLAGAPLPRRRLDQRDVQNRQRCDLIHPEGGARAYG